MLDMLGSKEPKLARLLGAALFILWYPCNCYYSLITVNPRAIHELLFLHTVTPIILGFTLSSNYTTPNPRLRAVLVHEVY
jgi:hypothetical protein